MIEWLCVLKSQVGYEVVDKAPALAPFSLTGWGCGPHVGEIGRSAGVVTALHLKKVG